MILIKLNDIKRVLIVSHEKIIVGLRSVKNMPVEMEVAFSFFDKSLKWIIFSDFSPREIIRNTPKQRNIIELIHLERIINFSDIIAVIKMSERLLQIICISVEPPIIPKALPYFPLRVFLKIKTVTGPVGVR